MRDDDDRKRPGTLAIVAMPAPPILTKAVNDTIQRLRTLRHCPYTKRLFREACAVLLIHRHLAYAADPRTIN